jgi:flagellar export protein FliJ
MGKFRFKFENIARIKETLKKKIQRDIGLIDIKISKFQRDIGTLKENFEKEKKYYFEKHAKVNEIQSLERHEIFIKKKIISFENEIKKLKSLRMKKIDELVSLSKDEKMLETLKENYLEKFREEERKTEGKLFDELALRKSSRGVK